MRIIIIIIQEINLFIIDMTDFEKYLKHHQQKQKTSKGFYYVVILSLVAVVASVVNISSF